VWQEQQKTINPDCLVFLDESSVNAGMTRLYGRALRNERVNDYVPDVRFERTSIMSTIRLNGDQVPVIYSGTLNSELFVEYLKNHLAPTLKKDDILVMDNCSAHTSKFTRKAIVELGIGQSVKLRKNTAEIEIKRQEVKAELTALRINTA